MAAPVVLCDEFIYANLAKNIAQHGHYQFRDVTVHPSLLYPLLLAPAWLARSMGTTYALAKGINASAMALVAVPVYLWGRRLVQPIYALLAAALTLLLPAFFFSGILMTEAAFLPAFVLATFALARMLERPTLLGQLAAFAAIALAVGIRVQGIVLLLVVPTAALLKVLLDVRAGVHRSELVVWLRRLWPTALLLGGGFLLYLLYKFIVSDAPLASGLGPYRSLAEAHYPLSLTVRWTVKHLAELGLAVGLVPLSALILMLWLALRRVPTTEAERAFLAVVPAAMLWVLVETGAFAATVTPCRLRALHVLSGTLARARVRALACARPAETKNRHGCCARRARPPPSEPQADGGSPARRRERVTLGSLYQFSLHLPGGIQELKAAIAAGALLAAFLFAICAKPVARIGLPLLLALYLGAAAMSAVDHTRNASQEARAVVGQRSELGRACRRARRAGRLHEHAGAGLELVRPPAPDRVLESERQPCLQRRLDRAVRAARDADDARQRHRSDRAVPSRQGSATRSSTVASRSAGSWWRWGGRATGRWPSIASTARLGSARTRTASTATAGWVPRPSTRSSSHLAGGRAACFVTLGRAGWGGTDVPGQVQISVGRPAPSSTGLAEVLEVRRWVVHRLAQRTFVFDVPSPPVRVEVQVTPTFSPAQFGLADTRQLGAQVSFSFRPRR